MKRQAAGQKQAPYLDAPVRRRLRNLFHRHQPVLREDAQIHHPRPPLSEAPLLIKIVGRRSQFLIREPLDRFGPGHPSRRREMFYQPFALGLHATLLHTSPPTSVTQE